MNICNWIAMQKNMQSESSFVKIDSTKLIKSSNKSYDKEIQNKTNTSLPYFYEPTFTLTTQNRAAFDRTRSYKLRHSISSRGSKRSVMKTSDEISTNESIS